MDMLLHRSRLDLIVTQSRAGTMESLVLGHLGNVRIHAAGGQEFRKRRGSTESEGAFSGGGALLQIVAEVTQRMSTWGGQAGKETAGGGQVRSRGF